MPFFTAHFLRGFPSFDLELNILLFATFNRVPWVFLNFIVFLQMFQQCSYNTVETGGLRSNNKSLYSGVKRQWETGFFIKVLFSGESRSFENHFSWHHNLLSLTKYRLLINSTSTKEIFPLKFFDKK